MYPQDDIVPTLVATKNTTIKLRLSEQELKEWQQQAKELGISLSELIRGRCNTSSAVKYAGPVTHEMVDREAARIYPEFARKPCKHGMLFCKTCK